MNGQNIEEWWQEKLLPDRFIIVIDNAPYHAMQTEQSKAPLTSWKKSFIQEWLTSNGIAQEPDIVKAKLGVGLTSTGRQRNSSVTNQLKRKCSRLKSCHSTTDSLIQLS